ncbi:MAG: universal stress protein [Actinomycetota bacterium]
MYQSIVVGIDGSETARAAMLKAASLAESTGAQLHLVMGSPASRFTDLIGIDPMSAGASEPLAEAMRQGDKAAAEILERAADELRARGLKAETYLIDGDPADALVGVAETAKADLIVVGNRGMRGAKRVLGSVPNSVAHHAPCDVTIVKTV